MKNTRYTIQRIRRLEDTLYGAVHATTDTLTTVCGKPIVSDGTWCILTTNYEGEPTCKVCISKLKKGVN